MTLEQFRDVAQQEGVLAQVPDFINPTGRLSLELSKEKEEHSLHRSPWPANLSAAFLGHVFIRDGEGGERSDRAVALSVRDAGPEAGLWIAPIAAAMVGLGNMPRPSNSITGRYFCTMRIPPPYSFNGTRLNMPFKRNHAAMVTVQCLLDRRLCLPKDAHARP